MAPARDLDPDPRVLEVDLEAYVKPMEIVPGKLTAVWTYNGQLPGPLLELLDLTIGYDEHQDVSMGINGVHPGMEGHGRCTAAFRGEVGSAFRRAPGHVDVPLPHPRSCRRRHDGPLARDAWRLSAARLLG